MQVKKTSVWLTQKLFCVVSTAQRSNCMKIRKWPFSSLGLEALWNSVYKNCKTHILIFVSSQLTTFMKLLSLLKLVTQYQSRDAIETHNRGPETKSSTNGKLDLMITDGELAHSHPDRPTLFPHLAFSSLPLYQCIRQALSPERRCSPMADSWHRKTVGSHDVC